MVRDKGHIRDSFRKRDMSYADVLVGGNNTNKTKNKGTTRVNVVKGDD